MRQEVNFRVKNADSGFYLREFIALMILDSPSFYYGRTFLVVNALFGQLGQSWTARKFINRQCASKVRS